jgi:hypothetical protein
VQASCTGGITRARHKKRHINLSARSTQRSLTTGTFIEEQQRKNKNNMDNFEKVA